MKTATNRRKQRKPNHMKQRQTNHRKQRTPNTGNRTQAHPSEDINKQNHRKEIQPNHREQSQQNTNKKNITKQLAGNRQNQITGSGE